jgi:branched-chain amino acid transport system substrate-binding protein
MRRYFTLIALIVTLAVAGCSGTPGTSQSPWRTPSGGNINDRLPDFEPVTEDQSLQQTPLPTTQSGRNAASPYFQRQAANKELPPVKIGFLVPLSGAQAPLGQAMLNAAQLALFDVGASNITLVPRDTNKGAARAASEVITEGAQIILGPLFANDVKAVSPIAAQSNLSVIAFSTDWTAANDNTYIMGFLPFGQVSRVTDFAVKRGAKKFAAIIPETPYGMVVNGTLKNELQRQQLPAPNSMIFNNTNGMSQAIQNIAKTQQPGMMETVDALMLPLGGQQMTQAATLLRQNDTYLRQMRIIGTGLWDDSMQAGAMLPGAWYAAPEPSSRETFNRQYAATYSAQPPRLASLAYDATALAAALAVKGLNTTGQPAFDRASLTNPSGFAGLDGIFRFRPDGLAERGLAILELQPGGPVVVDPAPKRF